MQTAAAKKSDNTKYYEILGIPKVAALKDIKNAYRKAAIKNPDKAIKEMLSRKEWAVEVVDTTNLISSHLSLVVAHLAEVVEAAEEEDKEEERMLSTFSRFLWRICTMEHQRNCHYLAIYCAKNAKGNDLNQVSYKDRVS
ncbi:hypothetical protein FXO38_36122 [Capsicum annuum]|uniref:J domain-containing protein n=1 Tax=Capsicum annuum TaxID=4072 RepID=A0A2G2ZI72_CAPAN|nr:hypothetical protein FXO38_36122 [Capsicum annuum]KAF3634539.1 hypothetical protein FXO37_26446 [Capsicum annuum]PHT81635.1 hypothetical protein T459_14650 [Capsicum annuum]